MTTNSPDEIPSDQVITELYIANKRCLYDRALYLKFLEVIKPSLKKSLEESDRQKLHKVLPLGVSRSGMGQILMNCLKPLEEKDSQALTAYYTDLMAQNKHKDFSHLLASAKILGIDQILMTAHAFLADAAAQGKFEFVKVLLESGAEVDFADAHGSTPLMRAAQSGFAEVVGLLLDHNALVDKKDTEGVTALMLGAKEGHLPVVRKLIAQGASIAILDLSGMSALEHAALSNRDEILKELGGQEAHKDVAFFKRKLRAGALARKAEGNIARATDAQSHDPKKSADESKKPQKNQEAGKNEKKVNATQTSWFSLQNGLVLGLCAFGAYLYYQSTQQSNQKAHRADRGSVNSN